MDEVSHWQLDGNSFRDDQATCAQCAWWEQPALWLYCYALKSQRKTPLETLLFIHLCSLMVTLNSIFSIVFPKDTWLCDFAVKAACIALVKCSQCLMCIYRTFKDCYIYISLFLFFFFLFVLCWVCDSFYQCSSLWCDSTMKHEARAARYFFLHVVLKVWALFDVGKINNV